MIIIRPVYLVHYYRVVNPSRRITRASCASLFNLTKRETGADAVLSAPQKGWTGRAPQLAALIGREGSLNVLVHWYIDIFHDDGALHVFSERAVTNQSHYMH